MNQEETRLALIAEADSLLGVPYELGAEWKDRSKPPRALDCSEFIEGIFDKAGLMIPDGSQAQYDYTVGVDLKDARPGDLAFFGKGKDPKRVYHVGVLFDQTFIIEARAFDPGRDWTGKVTRRERKAWEAYSNFLGYRSHPFLV